MQLLIAKAKQLESLLTAVEADYQQHLFFFFLPDSVFYSQGSVIVRKFLHSDSVNPPGRGSLPPDFTVPLPHYES